MKPWQDDECSDVPPYSLIRYRAHHDTAILLGDQDGNWIVACNYGPGAKSALGPFSQEEAEAVCDTLNALKQFPEGWGGEHRFSCSRTLFGWKARFMKVEFGEKP